MRKLLIADSSEDFIVTLQTTLRHEYELSACTDGETALELLNSFHPDILLINLSLPIIDGLLVLQQAVYLPNMILARATSITPYEAQCAKDMGVDLILQIPCSVRSIRNHLANLIRMEHIPKLPDPQDVTKQILLDFHLSPIPDGFQQLRVGVPLFLQDRQQLLFKELYPAIAQLCGKDDPRQIDSSIHRTIKAAWKNRDIPYWAKYFPDHTEPPANKEFLNTIADLLEDALTKCTDQ